MTHDAAEDDGAMAPSGMRPMILVVDDEAPVRSVLSRMFAASGLEVHAVDNVAEAIAVANTVRFDAAVIDLAMPLVTSGLNLLAWFRSQRSYSTLPVLILTGQVALDPDAEELIRRERAYVFYKGQSLKELVEYVIRLTAPPSGLY